MSTPEHDGEVFTLLPHEAARTIAQLRARVAELEELVGRSAVVISEHLPALGSAAEWQRRATAAEKRVDELLWIESTSCCGDQARQYGVRARKAEAQVAAVREALDELAAEADKRRGYREIQAAERAGLIMAISRFRQALDAASTPAGLTQPDASLTPHSGQDCPDRIEVTGWGMTDREWICGCDPRPDATAPAETTSPSEAP